MNPSSTHIKAPGALPRRQRGMTLVELMVAMLLGLVVTGVAVSVFLASRSSFKTNMAIGEVQDGSRIAFELLTRDARQASLTGCGNGTFIANVLKNSGTDWWANWGNAVRGYEAGSTDPAVTTGTATGNRLAATDSVQLIGSESAGLSIQNATAASVTLWSAATDWKNGDALLICDPDHAALVQLGGGEGTASLTWTTTGANPGNCAADLGFPTAAPVPPATACTAEAYTFRTNAQVSRLNAADWYIGTNPTGGQSLYRMTLSNSSGSLGATAQEIVRNVTDMQILYHQSSEANYVDASAVTNWNEVDAMQVTLTLASTTKQTVTDNNAKSLNRTVTTVIALRNRVS
jgi:type IV pilus assembly protein PilW